MRKVVLVGLIAAVLSGLYLISQTSRVAIVDTGQPYSRLYVNDTRGLRGAMAAGDGQAYGSLAQDPTMSRANLFVSGRPDAAYRYQRPVLGYLAWGASLGQPRLEAGAQAVLVVLGAAVAVGGCAELLRRRGCQPLLALAVLLVPGMQSALAGLTSEPVALAFLTLGLLAWWDQPRRVGIAALLFSLAALTRESSLVAMGALAIVEVFSLGPNAKRDSWRRVGPLFAPFAAYAAWAVVLRVRLGATPFAARSNRLAFPPLSGLAQEWTGFAEPARSWVWLLLGVVIVLVALVRRSDDHLAPVVLAFGVFAAFMGPAVWARWQDFSRPLLPLYAYGVLIVIALLAEISGRAESPSPLRRGLLRS